MRNVLPARTAGGNVPRKPLVASSVLRRVTGEDIVAIFGRHVTGVASSMLRCISRLPVLIKLSVPPPAGCGIFLGVLDHELQVPSRGGTGDKGLIAAKDLVVLFGRYVIPRESSNYSTVRERLLALAIAFDRYIVAQNGSNII